MNEEEIILWCQENRVRRRTGESGRVYLTIVGKSSSAPTLEGAFNILQRMIQEDDEEIVAEVLTE